MEQQGLRLVKEDSRFFSTANSGPVAPLQKLVREPENEQWCCSPRRNKELKLADFSYLYASSFGAASAELVTSFQENQKWFAEALLEKAKNICNQYGGVLH